MEPVKKNDKINIRISDIGNDGEGIGHLEDGLTVFVKNALPGDLVLALVLKVKKNYAFAKVLEVIEPSLDRCEPSCPIADKCGGCNLQRMTYAAQLKFKADKVRNDLMRIGGVVFASEDGAGASAGASVESGASVGAKAGSGVPADAVFEPIVGMEAPLRYRNKGQFPVGLDRTREGKAAEEKKDGRGEHDGKERLSFGGKAIVAGFYRERTHDIVDASDCVLQHPITAYLMRAVKEYMYEAGVEPYDEESRRGTIRHVLVRIGFATGEVMVCPVINARKLKATELLKEKLTAAVEEYDKSLEDTGKGSGIICGENGGERVKYRLASLACNINTADTNVILGEKVVNLLGPGYIRDVIGLQGGGLESESCGRSDEGQKTVRSGGITYRISPLSFYQVNPVQTARLYATVLEYAVVSGDETVWDIYCGIGTISLFLAKRAKKVYGVEIVPEAVEDARENAKENGILNAEFFVGAAEEVLPAKYSEDPSMRADVVVVDPPRKGCDSALLDCVAALEPQRIVYVSCDPATLSRDVKRLTAHGYEVKRVRPVDMFPQTVHVETVCLLSNRKPDSYVHLNLKM